MQICIIMHSSYTYITEMSYREVSKSCKKNLLYYNLVRTYNYCKNRKRLHLYYDKNSSYINNCLYKI